MLVNSNERYGEIEFKGSIVRKFVEKETISKKQLRKFGLLIGFGFPILIGWLLPVLFVCDVVLALVCGRLALREPVDLEEAERHEGSDRPDEAGVVAAN